MRFVPAGLQLLMGWKYPIYLGHKIFEWPGLIETLVDHGVPRELIRVAEHGFTNVEVFDFYARLHRNNNDNEHDEIAVVLFISVERRNTRFPGYFSGSSDVEIVRLPIVAPEWYKWKEERKKPS